MQVNNNTQSPNFGMALRINPKATENLKKCSIETIKKLQEAGEELKDTKFYHVAVDENLGCKIESEGKPYFGLFEDEENRITTSYGTKKEKDTNVTADNIIMIKQGNTSLGGVGKYIPYMESKPTYNAWGYNAYNQVGDIKQLSTIAKLLDKAAVAKYKEECAAAILKKAKEQEVSNAVDDLMKNYTK